MSRVIRFLGVLPLLFVSSSIAPPQAFPEAHEIPNWSAPPYWSPARGGRAVGLHASRVETDLTGPLPFVAVVPCRVVDTRGPTGTFGGPIFAAAEARTYQLSSNPDCSGFPAALTIAGYSVNVTVTETAGTGFLSAYPSGSPRPAVSLVNFVGAGQTISNATIVAAGSGGNAGEINVYASQQTHVIIDVNGYYDGSSSLQASLSRRAALDQFWTPQNVGVLGLTTVRSSPWGVRSDGADLWVANQGDGTISRVRGSDAKVLETWTGASYPFAVLVAMGKVFVLGSQTISPPGPGVLYRIDPSQSAGAVTMVASGLGSGPQGIAFDGARIWTANFGGSVSIVTPSATLPWTVMTVTTGFSKLVGAVFDGTNIWVTDSGANSLLKLDSGGAILQTVAVGSTPYFPAFDGRNIWVPNFTSSSVSVVRASDGAVLATLTGNGLAGPFAAAFDGQRVLVVRGYASLWKAADLTPLGYFALGGSEAFGVCSDGVNFWLTLNNINQLARF